jgi:hypothetical protein
MKRILAVAGIVTALAVSPALAVPDDVCAASWARADANKDGLLTVAEDSAYFMALRQAGKPVDEGKLNYAAFLENCKTAVPAATMIVGAPLPGANSFTEDQARERAVAEGFTAVSPLTKDANGIWRGTAMKGSSTTPVAVDYKGNVVSQ